MMITRISINMKLNKYQMLPDWLFQRAAESNCNRVEALRWV